MKILAIAQVEDDTYIKQQIANQTIQPDYVDIYVDKEPASGISERRIRIADNHHKLKEIVKKYDVDLIWQVEGDAQLPENTLEKLIADYEQLKDTNLGYITGVQVGRHGLYALGAWHIAKDRQSFYSLDYTKKGLQRIDASGFYCLLAKKDIWLSGVAYWNQEVWGPDVNWGLSLSDYDIYADLDIQIGHKIKGGIIKVSDMSTCNVHFYKENNRWTYKQIQ
jgi:hypothetical protein